MRKLEQYASWLEREWPSAAASLREGLSELFTVNRLGLPKPLRRCLTTTNIIDSSYAGVRQHKNRVSRWQSEEMAVRWAGVTFRETEKHYRRITGYEHLWMLKAHRVRLFFVGGPERSRRGCERHGKSYLTRRRRGEEGDGGGSLTGGAIPSA